MSSPVTLIVPNGINLLNAVAASMNNNGRADLDSQIVLPSLRQRAYVAVHELGVIAVQTVDVAPPTSTFRGG